jgi:hypothetical protein
MSEVETLDRVQHFSGSGPDITVNVNTKDGEKRVVLDLTGDERVDEFFLLLQRALNTMDPSQAPEWAIDIMDKVQHMPARVRREAPVQLLLDGAGQFDLTATADNIKE